MVSLSQKKVPSIEIRSFVVNLRSYTFGNLFCVKLFCFTFAVLCYLAGREVIIISLFMYKSIQIPKVSQRTFKTKGLIPIEGTFLGDTLYIQHE